MSAEQELADLREAIRLSAEQWAADPAWFAMGPSGLLQLIDGDLERVLERLRRNAEEDYILLG